MDWSPQQERALAEVASWIQNPDARSIFYLFGFAGTGKTTLAKHLAEGVSGDVLFGAFTGKAASVLQSKGCPNAMTVHQMIYQVSDKSKRRLREMQEDLAQRKAEGATDKDLVDLNKKIKAEQDSVNQPMFTVNPNAPASEASLLVIDEWSMVSERMAEDLLSFNKPILALGDPAQLPPVAAKGYQCRTPDIVLDEIHRQAADNPIIQLATMVRNGQGLDYGEYGESMIVRKPTPDQATGVDQILCGTNKTRAKCINRMRQLGGFTSPMPQVGERLVCLRNNHELGLLNGMMFNLLSVGPAVKDQIQLTVEPVGGGDKKIVVSWVHHFQGRERQLDPWTKKDAQEFGYGYALTTHKAQGSQWDSVMIFDESWVFKQDARKWLYTAITRAAERVIIVR